MVARVRGSRMYGVQLQLAEMRGDSATLRVSCACPRFSDGHNCLVLQQRKRALADAVINAGASVLRSLTREDLEMLLGRSAC
ncbi:MAG TPA: hypothetical protein VFT98_10280 [Myxococcota bacterium]|nr:hypothetical protein [Myxococcota bacterium]